MTDSPLQHKPFLRLVTSESMPDAAQGGTSAKPKASTRRRTKTSGGAASDYPLRAILDIQVSGVSKETIEQMCHLDTPDAELTDLQRRERRLLGDFGLEVQQSLGALPAAIVLKDKRWFRKVRPELKHLAKLLEESGGVVPYTPGHPRIDTKPVRPTPTSLSGTPLLAVLQAKLTPDLTVEDASHLRTYYEDEEHLIPGWEQIWNDWSLLRAAGLDIVRAQYDDSSNVTAPAAIVLRDERAFARTFPELAHLSPQLVYGVIPYTRGLPRITKFSTTFTPRASSHLKLVSN